MSRMRTIKPSFFTHEVLAELSPLHRILFQGLWCNADREGRMEDRPKYIKAVVLPYDDADVESMLSDLQRAGFILRYRVAGQSYICIPAFHKHQRPHPNEAKSAIPPPEAAEIVSVVMAEDEAKTLEVATSEARSTKVIRPSDQGTSPDVSSRVGSGILDLRSGILGVGVEASLAQAAPAPIRSPASHRNKKPDPDHQPLTWALCEEFLKARGSPYGHSGAIDAKAVQRLLAMSRDVEEHLARWRRALGRPGAQGGCSSIAIFASRWNEYAGTGPPAQGRDPTRGQSVAKAEWTEKDISEFQAMGRPEVRHG